MSEAMDGSVAETCRSCGARLGQVFADLGLTPIANAFPTPDQYRRVQPFYPLRALVCDGCRLVQLGYVPDPARLFPTDYPYFSSFSDHWLAHAARYADRMAGLLDLGPRSRVVEVGSNDGYLLQYFQRRGIPVLGVDPARDAAEAATRTHGIETLVRFFGAETARDMREQGLSADLLVANNVLAHVPAINDFLAGFRILLRPQGVITFEFPHLLDLIDKRAFDTIYHEHCFYLSLFALERALSSHDLAVFDVERLSTHGGSLRVFVGHRSAGRPESDRVRAMRSLEAGRGLRDREVYDGFARSVAATKRRLLGFLIDAAERGARVAAYGAPAKGNTLLNYCGIRRDLIDFTVDRNPRKQGLLLPGTGIPVEPPEAIFERRPDYLLILPWNLRAEIVEQMRGIRDWGGRFVVPIPEVEVLA